MIIFEKVRYKNILSVGNNPIEIDFLKSPTTLICGKNGKGKSTFLDAITFALFGKAFRKIVKGNIVNSVNGRECLVELWLTVGSTKYLIKRGIKPDVFEIYSNGTLINQDANSRDYQKIIENTVIKMSEKSFRQVVVLGSATFAPFMQLPLPHRREVIEDLLDVYVFSNMNTVLKKMQTEVETELKEIDAKVTLIDSKITMLNQFIASHTARIKQSKESTQQLIIEEANKHKALVAEEIALQEKLAPLCVTFNKNYGPVKDKMDKLWRMQVEAENNIKALNTNISFFDKDNCPTCKQGITHEHKEAMVGGFAEQKASYEQGLERLNLALEAARTQFKELEAIKAQVDAGTSKITLLQHQIMTSERTQKTLKESLTKVDEDKDLTEDLTKLETLKAQLITGNSIKAEKLTYKDYLNDIAIMLKDTGIKTKIIKHYLPIINQTINNYLAQLGLHVKFTLDETFNETIKSRFKDEFSYYNFSEGEKARIDLAIMFAWRHIAALKNSTNTNLLIMDETFDSSLDADGTQELLTLIDELVKVNKTNVFVISHKSTDVLYDKFRSVIQIDMVNGFTKIV